MRALLFAVMAAMVGAKPFNPTIVPAATTPPACQGLTPTGNVVDNTYFKKTTAQEVYEEFRSAMKDDEDTVVKFVPTKAATISRSEYNPSPGSFVKVKLVSDTGAKAYVQVEVSKTCSVEATVGWKSIDKVDYYSEFHKGG